MSAENLAPIVAIAMLFFVAAFGYFGNDVAGICAGAVGGLAWAFPDVTGGMRGMSGNAGGAAQFVTMMRFVLYCGIALLVFRGGDWLSF